MDCQLRHRQALTVWKSGSSDTWRSYQKMTRPERDGKTYLGVPHRLDRPASGILLFARHKNAARKLADQFRMRQVRKTYLVLVADSGTQQPGWPNVDGLDAKNRGRTAIRNLFRI